MTLFWTLLATAVVVGLAQTANLIASDGLHRIPTRTL
jgi:hypothetical protein